MGKPKCGYQYYNQELIDSNPEYKRTDTFLRFLLCNQESIQQLYNAWYLARQLPAEGRYYCYRFFNIFTLPGPNGEPGLSRDDPANSKVYSSTRIFQFWLIASKMGEDAEYNKKVLTERKVLVQNPYNKNDYQEVHLDDLDIQVLILLRQRVQFEEFYVSGRLAFSFVATGRYYCFLVNGFYDFNGELLAPLVYNGRALKELFMVYSTDFANFTSPTGAKCLLNRCEGKDEPVN
jgi:hypothetical protein